jgi:TatA/E family protein of Tat protein translocase
VIIEGGAISMGMIFQGDEYIILLFVILLVLGPSKLPQLARGLGQAVREFRKASAGLYDELEETKKAVSPPSLLDTKPREENK